MTERRRCPDGGACHHACALTCYRTECCGPLSGVFPGDRWPDLRHQLQEYTDTTAAYHRGEDVVPGDCWRTALACLLEVSRDQVPHFAHLYPNLPDDADPAELAQERRLIESRGARWWRESVAWVEAQRPGWTLACWKWEGFPLPSYTPEEVRQGAPDRLILTGPSPRGDWNHSVLVSAATGDLEHDPMPDGPGLGGPGLEVFALVRPEWLER